MASETVNPASAAPDLVFERFAFGSRAVDQANLPGDAVMRFVNLTHDIADGSESVTSLLEWDVANDPPLLSEAERSTLSRFTSASLRMLVAECDRVREWAFEVHTEEGRQDALRKAAMLATRRS